MRKHGVRCLLMGGQACVFYGAAEFSRDIDFALWADPENLDRLHRALKELQADVIAVPPNDITYLQRGHAIHFRCRAEGTENFRIDVMSRMRGVDDFDIIWQRRTTIEVDGLEVDLLSLPDLIAAKKTQRAKDWPMIQRLVEANWYQNRHHSTPLRIAFWLRECRTPVILMQLVQTYREEAIQIAIERPLLAAAIEQNDEQLDHMLEEERQAEISKDQAYWQPLRKELEALRRRSSTNDPTS